MSRETIHHIKCLEQQIGEAVISRDASFVEELWHEDFAYTGPRGEVKSKSQIVRELRNGELEVEQLKLDELQVRVHGPMAVVTGLATTKGRLPAGQLRYTRVYQQKDGQWKLMAYQGTPLAA